MQKLLEFRIKVFHEGKFISENEAKAYAKAVFNTILCLYRTLSEKYHAEVSKYKQKQATIKRKKGIPQVSFASKAIFESRKKGFSFEEYLSDLAEFLRIWNGTSDD